MMRPLLIVLLVLAVSAPASRADGILSWPAADRLPKQATIAPVPADENPILQVVGPTDAPGATILEVAAPAVTSHHYVVRGQVKYEGVEQGAFVEMWSHFGGQEAYFSRTLAPSGPMGKLEGDSDWRVIELPFTGKPGKVPVKLVINVVLPGKGTVQLMPLTLTSVAAASSAEGVWWSESQAGLVGGIGGGALGLLGAIIGTLAGFGVARKWVVGLCIAVIAVCSLSLVVGIVAPMVGQAWHVYYPLLLCGMIGVTVCGANLPGIRKRYDALELRRMSAMDA